MLKSEARDKRKIEILQSAKGMGGRGNVRAVLYMATLVAIRFNTKIKSYYMHLKSNGKESKVAIVACMRKFITILNYLVRTDQLWNAN